MGIVRPEGTDVNDGRLFRQISGPEEQAPAVSASGELAKAMQATEMVRGIAGTGGRLLEP